MRSGLLARWLPLLAWTALLAGCASGIEPEPGSGIGWVSRERKGKVEHLVLHHTGVGLAESLRILSGRDPERRVSSHYLVTDESPPRVIALVPEGRVAFHAGVSYWRGRQGLNETSVGIEIVNLDGNAHPYPEAQFLAVAELCAAIVRRHGIDPRDVVAHSDIAPGRKVDPGRLFPWERLHREHGVGPWPTPANLAKAKAGADSPAPPSPAELRGLLADWGYAVGSSPGWDDADRQALAAFQRRFHPARVSGQPDAETVRRLRALLAGGP